MTSELISSSDPTKGPWNISVEGWDILTVHFAFQIDLFAYGNGVDCMIRLAGAFRLSEPDGRGLDLDAERQPWEEPRDDDLWERTQPRRGLPPVRANLLALQADFAGERWSEPIEGVEQPG